MPDVAAMTYRAFLSYSHRDTAWAKWLHKALEGYRIDKDLVGRVTSTGPIPKTLSPIFHDREDFSAGHSLNEQTLAALECSEFLVVLCSPNAVKSAFVNEEVRRFKMLGRGARVIPVIIDGEPNDPERECFPSAVRFKLTTDGTISNECEEPIAADARREGDGKILAKLKVIAGILGLRLDEVIRRAERSRKRRNKFWMALAGVFLVLAFAAFGSAAYAWQQLKTNEALLNATLKRATQIVDTAVEQAQQHHVPRAVTLQLLANAEGLFDDMARLGRPTLELRYRKAWMLIEFARNYEVLGDSSKQRDRAAEAHRVMLGVTAQDRANVEFRRELGVTDLELGDVLMEQGNLQEALGSYLAGLAIFQRVADGDVENGVWQRDLLLSYLKVGDVLVKQGNLPEAFKNYNASLTVSQRLAGDDPRAAARDFSSCTSKSPTCKRCKETLSRRSATTVQALRFGSA